MKKFTTLCLLACAFTISNNSFAMLTKTSSIKQIKKIRSFHTTNAWDRLAYNEAKNASAKASENNELLQKIINQNQKNNELLRAVIQQNYLLSHRVYNNCAQRDDNIHSKLIHFQDMLEKRYHIKMGE